MGRSSWHLVSELWAGEKEANLCVAALGPSLAPPTDPGPSCRLGVPHTVGTFCSIPVVPCGPW